jgi:hypothetical protein
MNEAEQAKALAERRKAYMEGDFDPGYRPSGMPTADLRIASAAEYSAYQLGKLNRNLEKLILVLQSRA